MWFFCFVLFCFFVFVFVFCFVLFCFFLICHMWSNIQYIMRLIPYALCASCWCQFWDKNERIFFGSFFLWAGAIFECILILIPNKLVLDFIWNFWINLLNESIQWINTLWKWNMIAIIVWITCRKCCQMSLKKKKKKKKERNKKKRKKEKS